MCFHRYWRRYYRKLPFFERFLRAGRYSNEIPRTDRHNTGEHKHWAWLDDIILVTKGNMDKHEAEVRETMTKMEQIGQWTNWKELPKSTYQKAKKIKSFLEAIQYLSKYMENLSANTDILGKLLKKQNNWIWTDEHTKALNNLKEGITKIPCLAHYNAQSENIITIDASRQRLAATLWQKQKTGELKPIGFASRFLSDTEKNTQSTNYNC